MKISRIVAQVMVLGFLLCFLLVLPSAAYNLFDYFIVGIETVIPHTSFTSSQLSNFRGAAGKWNTAAGETLFSISSSTHSSTTNPPNRHDGNNYIHSTNIGAEYLALCYRPATTNGYITEFDIVMNTHYPWGGTNGFDFYSVFLHEMGHAAGLDHSTHDEAVMFAGGLGVGDMKRILSADDNAGIQAIYYWNW